MCEYVYGFDLEAENDEYFFRFPRFPFIISAVDRDKFASMSVAEKLEHAHDAVVTALQAQVSARDEIPEADDPRTMVADGFVHLRVNEAMKLELYKLYRENCRSVADFARRLNKPETSAHRLLRLDHRSRASEIESAIASFGKRLVHDWGLEPVSFPQPKDGAEPPMQ